MAVTCNWLELSRSRLAIPLHLMTHYCRHCGSVLSDQVIDLGHQPPSNAYLRPNDLSQPEFTYPLKVYICTSCWLMQLPAHVSSEDLFTSDYAYFSSTSTSWWLTQKILLRVIDKLSLDANSFVVELV